MGILKRVWEPRILRCLKIQKRETYKDYILCNWCLHGLGKEGALCLYIYIYISAYIFESTVWDSDFETGMFVPM